MRIGLARGRGLHELEKLGTATATDGSADEEESSKTLGVMNIIIIREKGSTTFIRLGRN